MLSVLVLLAVIIAGIKIKHSNLDKNNMICHDITELENLQKEETYTHKEMVNYLASNVYSTKEAQKIMGMQSGLDNVHYSIFKMNSFSYKIGGSKVTLEPRFVMGLEYNDKSNTPNKILSLHPIGVFDEDGFYCVFDGNILCELTSGNSFYYNIYGNLYKKGISNYDFVDKITVGLSATIKGNVNNVDNHYKNISESEEYYSSKLTN